MLGCGHQMMSSPKDLNQAKASEVIFPARRSWTTSRQSATSLRRHFDQSPSADFCPFDLAAFHLVVDHRAAQAGSLGGVIDRACRPFAEWDALRSTGSSFAGGRKMSVGGHDRSFVHATCGHSATK